MSSEMNRDGKARMYQDNVTLAVMSSVETIALESSATGVAMPIVALGLKRWLRVWPAYGYPKSYDPQKREKELGKRVQ